MYVIASVAGFLVWTALCAVAWHVVRTRVRRIEQSDLDRSEKVHRVQKLLVAASFGTMVIFLVVGAGAGAAGGAVRHHPDADKAAVLVALLGAVVVGLVTMVGVLRTPRKALARVRDVPLRAPDRRRAVIAALVGGLCYAALLIGGMALVPRHGEGHVIGRMVVYVVALFLLSALVLPLVIVRFRSTALTGETRTRLDALAARIGVHVRDFRVIKGRGQKVANAAQMGVLPGLRYVLLTDYLLDELEPHQLEAVVAHELGHARRHHVLVKLGAVVGVWIALEALLLALGRGSGAATALLTLPVFIAFPFGILLVQGLVGVRLETAADDIAAHEVGAQPLVEALEHIGQLNDTKRDTSRRWALITQHPGLQTRLDHLRKNADVSLSTPGVAGVDDRELVHRR